MNTERQSKQLRDESPLHAMSRETLGEASKLIWDFLTLFADRRYEEANAFLAPDCRMLFPGGIAFGDCTELPKRSAATYRWVKKVFDHFDEVRTAEGTVVYNFGSLRGEWADGESFEGVRYIDRFLIQDGKIADQKVWNDLCVAAMARAASNP